MQIGLVDLFLSWNFIPRGAAGHSSGEIAAAYAIGALSFEDCTSLAYFRGIATLKLKEKLPKLKGAMTAIGGAPSDLFVSLCNLNTGNGEEASIDTVIEFGPHPALKGSIRQILSAKEVSASKISYLPTLLRGEDALNTMLDTAGALFMKGSPIHLPTINFPTPDPLMPEVLSDLQPYP